jgi:putative ABC transport system ATP-binding protein
VVASDRAMLLSAQQISKTYHLGGDIIQVAAGLDLMVGSGDFVAIMGTSGSGKSTLLHIFGGLARPDSGRYVLNGKDMLSLNDVEQSRVRANWIGFVFQTFNLLPELDVVGNVSLPFLYKNVGSKEKQERVEYAIDCVRLSQRKKHRPLELSGGEMQRVAIARALAINPLLMLAAEPTGNLDDKNSDEVLKIFHEMNSAGVTIIMVTHDRQVASVAKRILFMRDGLLWQK